MIFSASLYYIQFELLDFPNDQYGIRSALFRACRMIIGYVIPSAIFIKRYHGSLKTMGFQLAYNENNSIQQYQEPSLFKSTIFSSRVFVFSLSFLGGLCVYLVASYVFVKYRIFFSTWNGIPLNLAFYKLAIIGVMAAITDLWTRGFILLQLESKYGAIIAILGQNIIWFGIHVYEIEFLVSYISYAQAIALTLFLGLAGDIITLKSKNITGLMVGHVVLNLAILLGSHGFIG